MTTLDNAKPALPERDDRLPDEQQGAYRKFAVTRTDGSSAPGGKHEHCEYFVLDVDCDPHAAAALTAYANAAEATHPKLASDMRQRYGLPSVPGATRADYMRLIRDDFERRMRASGRSVQRLDSGLYFSPSVDHDWQAEKRKFAAVATTTGGNT